MTGVSTQQDATPSLAENLLGLTVASCLFLFVLSLPPFHLGLSVQTETASAALHLMSAVIALLCSYMVWQGNRALLASLCAPWVLLSAALGLWTALAGMLSDRLLASLSGALDQGVGALIVIESGLLVAVTHYLWRRTQWRQVLLACALVGYVVVLILDFTGRGDRGMAPYYFGDYIAFIAFGFMGIALSAFSGIGKWWFVAALLGTIPGILLSDNKAAAGGWLLVVLMIVIMTRFRREQCWVSWYVPLVIVLVCSGAIYLIGNAYRPEEIDRLLTEYGHAPFPAFVLSVWASLWSRAMLIKVSVAGLVSDWNILTGDGWGMFNEVLIRNLRLVDSRQHELVGDTLVYWDAIERNDFHSHNFLIETALSGGVIAVVIGVLLFFCVLRHWHMARNIFGLSWLAGLIPVLCFWFQLPVTAVWLSVGLGALLRGLETDDKQAGRTVCSRTVISGVSLSLLTFGLLLICVTVSALNDSRKADALLHKNFSAPQISLNCSVSSLTLWHESAYLSRLISVEADRLVSAKNGAGQDNAERRLEAFLCHSDRLLLDRSEIRLLTTVINASGLIRFSGVDVDKSEFSERLLSRWDSYADRLLEVQSGRIDLLIPYFNHLLLSGGEDRILNMANRSLVPDPNEPVALWFKGIVLLGKPGEEGRGLALLKSAAKWGISDLMPIPAEMRTAIGLLP